LALESLQTTQKKSHLIPKDSVEALPHPKKPTSHPSIHLARQTEERYSQISITRPHKKLKRLEKNTGIRKKHLQQGVSALRVRLLSAVITIIIISISHPSIGVASWLCQQINQFKYEIQIQIQIQRLRLHLNMQPSSETTFPVSEKYLLTTSTSPNTIRYETNFRYPTIPYHPIPCDPEFLRRVFQFLGLCGGRVESIFSLALAADKKAKSKSKSKCSGSADAFSAHAPLVCAAGVGGKFN